MISRLLGGLRKPPNASRVSKRRMARFILNAEIRRECGGDRIACSGARLRLPHADDVERPARTCARAAARMRAEGRPRPLCRSRYRCRSRSRALRCARQRGRREPARYRRNRRVTEPRLTVKRGARAQHSSARVASTRLSRCMARRLKLKKGQNVKAALAGSMRPKRLRTSRIVQIQRDPQETALRGPRLALLALWDNIRGSRDSSRFLLLLVPTGGPGMSGASFALDSSAKRAASPDDDGDAR
jgi:hypothetical protein